MQEIAAGFERFRREAFPPRAELFRRLATTHTPNALFIGCSDARVVPELITQREPGELFVIRTAGNLVPPHGQGADGVAASIEYAVNALGVADIIVCGHSACGAMTALASGTDMSSLPATADWLRHADASQALLDASQQGEERIAALIRFNVAAQLTNLRTHPSVARALAREELALHGWVYDIGSGDIETVDTTTGTVTPLTA
ncbi:carbonic anhydrase [Streptomyces spiroverticillatus]|uniref:Carbonic anhydrase n=1 Tax=Streptomyces finlayi TaxID=67296 RepID=A0A918WUR3_9ACTN|nr:carbonic anhydrase [Streptomyces finlayi]GHA00150.1 carbonic anhydrase [Streptomyces spiroverticillatus]GHC84655.1 carbonic anhydrase [Streptomyces finlayi]